MRLGGVKFDRGWLLTFLLTGSACSLLGAAAALTSRKEWQLSDSHAGILLGLLFAGSFTGTISLSRNLYRSQKRGSWMSCFGLLAFALCLRFDHSVVAAAIALYAVGVGLAQLMSSINLLAGTVPVAQRTSTLARLAAAWCVGAALSPHFSSRPSSVLTPDLRIGLLAILFLVPLFIRDSSCTDGSAAESDQLLASVNTSDRVTLLCGLAFLLYAGVEASVSGWLPLFANRSAMQSLSSAQWLTTAFWSGLIVTRVALPAQLESAHRSRLLRICLGATLTMLLGLLCFPSAEMFVLSAFVCGLSLGPGFPLMLSLCLEWRLTTRRMAVVLASCGVGGAIFPLILGQFASAASLRYAMLVPVLAIGALLCVPWLPATTARMVLRQKELTA